MFKQKPFPFSLLILGIVILLHVLGSYFSLYWAYPWFDMVVHIMSGLWIALLILWLASIMGQINSLREYQAKSFLIAIVSAVLIGVVWEILENISQVTFVNANNYNYNTALDILNDGLGGLLAYIYFIQRKRSTNQFSDVLHPFYNQTGVIKS